MAPDAPVLSVIVPTRNTRELTLACLRSLAAARPPEPMEVLVVDDGSDDGTAKAVGASFPAVRVLRNPEPRGFTGAANRGLEEAGGRILLLLNSDTEVEEGAVQALLEGFEEPDLGVVGATLFYPDGRPQWSGGQEPTILWLALLSSGLARVLSRFAIYRRLRELARPTDDSAAIEVDWVTGAALAVTRDVIEQIGPLDDRFEFYAQDLDLCLRAREVGWRVALLPAFRVLHHHGSSISREGSTVRSQQLELLWTDLLRWAEKRNGKPWARKARRALRWGAKLRILARTMLSSITPRHRRSAWREETAAYRSALSALDDLGRDF